VPAWLDTVPDGSEKAAARDLGASYDKSLRMLQQYAAADVAYERAAYDRRMRQTPGVAVGLHEAVVLVADATRTLKLPQNITGRKREAKAPPPRHDHGSAAARTHCARCCDHSSVFV
jgi:hypothetical protein